MRSRPRLAAQSMARRMAPSLPLYDFGMASPDLAIAMCALRSSDAEDSVGLDGRWRGERRGGAGPEDG